MIHLKETLAISADRRDLAKTPAIVSPPSAQNYDVSSPWESDNQAWWDWYVGLAHNRAAADKVIRSSLSDRLRRSPKYVALDPHPFHVTPLELNALKDELETPYPLSPDACDQFRAEGYVKLPGVLSPGAVVALRREVVAVLEATFGVELDAGGRANRSDGEPPEPGRRFYSAEMIWLENPVIRLFVLSPRIGKICADLLGVERIRLYHDNLLSKEPGCGRTPWHYDDHHFPLATDDVVTAWIAAQAIPEAMGPLAFAKGMETWHRVADVPFSKVDTSYDRRVAEIFDELGVDVDDGPFAVGEVSFHHNLSFHTAGPNETRLSRCALANTFYADGARVMDAPTMVSGDWRKFLPGVEPGEPAASPVNPVCWPPSGDWCQSMESKEGRGENGV